MTIIKKEELSSWAGNIESLNQSAVSALNDLQSAVNRISEGYKGASSSVTIENMTSDIESATSCHQNTSLQDSLENVILFAEQV